MVGLVWKLFCSLRSCSVIVEFVVCDGGEAMWGPATQTVFFFFQDKARGLFQKKLLQPVVTFKAKTNKTPKRLKEKVETTKMTWVGPAL